MPYDQLVLAVHYAGGLLLGEITSGVRLRELPVPGGEIDLVMNELA